jgi:hypothetical protein
MLAFSKWSPQDREIMKYLILGVIFIGVPFGLLNWVVMPQLQALAGLYEHSDAKVSQLIETGQ